MSHLGPARGTCFCCGGQVPEFYHLMWCDSCIDELRDSGEGMDAFIARKRREQTMPLELPVETTKEELFDALAGINHDQPVRFSFVGEEMEVIEIKCEDGIAWISLRPKGEGELGLSHYIGRHREPAPKLEDKPRTEP